MEAFAGAVTDRVETLLDERTTTLVEIDAALEPVAEHLLAFAHGGKRMRARFLLAGAQAVSDRTDPEVASLLVDAAAAIELFQAAALVHDDVLDRSDTRRGAPAVHRAFESLHTSRGWRGDAAHFGVAAALLVGDLFVVAADDCFAAMSAAIPHRGRAALARSEFARMRWIVTAGQYLDVESEVAWRDRDPAQRSRAAMRIATAKSATYSVESPLVIGARIAGGDDRQVARLRAYGVPLGIAFQLRDDLLGVFGDPARTGKPAGDDLREGKRTLLVAEAQARLDEHDRAMLDAALGDPDLDEARIDALRELVEQSGARAAIEDRIDALAATASAALEDARELEAAALEPMRALLRAAVERSA